MCILRVDCPQAYGKTTYLSTNLQRVPRGTEGAVSLEGTAAGILAALLFAALAVAVGQVRITETLSGWSSRSSQLPSPIASGTGAARARQSSVQARSLLPIVTYVEHSFIRGVRSEVLVQVDLRASGFVVIAATAANFFESYLGATVQGQQEWLTNDVVNMIQISVAAAIAIVLQSNFA